MELVAQEWGGSTFCSMTHKSPFFADPKKLVLFLDGTKFHFLAILSSTRLRCSRRNSFVSGQNKPARLHKGLFGRFVRLFAQPVCASFFSYASASVDIMCFSAQDNIMILKTNSQKPMSVRYRPGFSLDKLATKYEIIISSHGGKDYIEVRKQWQLACSSSHAAGLSHRPFVKTWM